MKHPGHSILPGGVESEFRIEVSGEGSKEDI
jgi:hypothetical protein